MVRSECVQMNSVLTSSPIMEELGSGSEAISDRSPSSTPPSSTPDTIQPATSSNDFTKSHVLKASHQRHHHSHHHPHHHHGLRNSFYSRMDNNRHFRPPPPTPPITSAGGLLGPRPPPPPPPPAMDHGGLGSLLNNLATAQLLGGSQSCLGGGLLAGSQQGNIAGQLAVLWSQIAALNVKFLFFSFLESCSFSRVLNQCVWWVPCESLGFINFGVFSKILKGLI